MPLKRRPTGIPVASLSMTRLPHAEMPFAISTSVREVSSVSDRHWPAGNRTLSLPP